MPPAHQRLGAANLARLGIDDRLIVQLEFVLLDGAAQVAFDLLARARDLAHLRIEEAIAVAAGRFRPVERKIRHLQEIVGAGLVLGRQRDADAGADADVAAVDVERLAQHLDDALRQRLAASRWSVSPD